MCHGCRVRRKWWDLSKTVAAATIKKKTPAQRLSTSAFVLVLIPVDVAPQTAAWIEAGAQTRAPPHLAAENRRARAMKT